MATEKRLIDANALKGSVMKEIRHYWNEGEGGYYLAEDVIPDIDLAPTVDAVEVVHGRWEKAHIAGYLKCNCCKDAFIYEEWLESGKWNYCPNCGAKMDGERRTEC
jgi:hypothetical protein